ncbi:kelch-like protein 41 [Arctopsyche grandis]|uniref:kelch-like protein 41 n=1 Tax=Arctopsyche grandis TaxID=121162 RepID=UPI00406D9980
MFRVKRKSDFAAKRVAYLYDAMKQAKFRDTGFDVRDKMFYAHLIVLTACSEFFENKETDVVEDIMSHFDYEVIEAILKYCYTGQITIEDKHSEKIKDLAKRLGVKIPPQFKTVDISNCLKVLKHSGDSELIKKAMDLSLENFGTLYKTGDFLNLPTYTVTEILKSDDLIVPSEEDVFNAVKLWVNRDNANRKIKLAQLMRSVRLSLLSMKFLVDEVMTFCLSCADCMTTIRQAIIDKDDKSSIQRDTPRRKKQNIAVVGGLDFDKTSTIDIGIEEKLRKKSMEPEKIALVGRSTFGEANAIDIYDGTNNSWTLSKEIRINKCGFASVLVGDWILIIGGQNSSFKSLTSVEYIDLKSGQKHPLKPLNQDRVWFSAVTLRRDSSTDVYAIAGDNSDKSVERWNSKTGDWEIIAPLLMDAYLHSSSVIDGKIFVTGGRVRGSSTNKVQMYSVETNSWTYRAPMIQARQRHSSVAFKGKLYVAGGRGQKNDTDLNDMERLKLSYTRDRDFVFDSVEQYDHNANVWRVFTKLPRPQFEMTLCCFQNKLLSMGGWNCRDVWEYEETTKSWKALTQIIRNRNGAVAHVIPYYSII